jgi:hypothetical protein
MEWRLAVVKKNGGIRKQFLQWIVPTEIRQELSLKDGSRCTITAHLRAYSFGPRVYVLTSGGEFRLPKTIAEDLRSRATADPTAKIAFDIHVDGSTPQSVMLEKAREQAIEEGAFDPQNDEDARDRAAALIVRRQGQPEFRKKLLKAYNNRCAISRCDCPDALEAAHIRPYKGKYTNHIKNGLLLRSDIHTLVDLGKIRIDSNYKIGVCDELQSTVYKEFHDKSLDLPTEQKDWPDCSGLSDHI